MRRTLLALSQPVNTGSSSGSHGVRKAYNPYRPEVPLPAAPLRRAVIRKLKFVTESHGLLASDGSVSSAHSEVTPSTLLQDGLQTSYMVGAEPGTGQPLNLNSHVPAGGRSVNINSAAHTLHSSSSHSRHSSLADPSDSQSDSLPPKSIGSSRNSRYNHSSSAPSASLVWLLALAAAAAGGGYLYSRSNSSENNSVSAQVARDAALSNEPYNAQLLQQILADFPRPPEDDPSLPMAERMETWIKSLQNRICQAIERVEADECHSTTSKQIQREPGTFYRDSWLRKEGGEGISCVLQNGRIFEKSGVNVSVVYGKLPPRAVESMTADHEGKFKGWYDGKSLLPFKALGISCVMHPHNPACPTVHFNYRYFEVEDPKNPGQPKAWWFGGGSDLTPSYLFPVDAQHFHTSIASRCTNPAYSYARFKKWCDDYFLIKHRGERRGLGGIFFDDLSTAPGDTQGREDLFSWVKSCGEGFVESYVPIVQRRKHAVYTARMKQWQQLRRGRYVEFNLVYDRGTQFGLRTPGARIESILMSLPLTARWEYYAKLGQDEGSEEAKLLHVLSTPATLWSIDMRTRRS